MLSRSLQKLLIVSAGAVVCPATATKASLSPVPSRNLSICGSTVQVDFAAVRLDFSEDAILHWVQISADAVATYYGRFPVSHDTVLIIPEANQSGVLSGRTWGSPYVRSHMVVGQNTTEAELREDWVMTHEFVHTAFPDQDEQHHWIEEGLATYVEPIARVQRGVLSEDKVWADMIRDMPKGEPGWGDRGLDRTPTWGRTYWGGAMFFLLADVTIRDRTGNRLGLQDALRAIVAAGRNIQTESTPQDAFAIGDKAVGLRVLESLYENMRDKPVTVDLEELWRRLGVQLLPNGRIVYNDAAPSAGARKAIFRSREACKSQPS